MHEDEEMKMNLYSPMCTKQINIQKSCARTQSENKCHSGIIPLGPFDQKGRQLLT